MCMPSNKAIVYLGQHLVYIGAIAFTQGAM